MLYYLIIGLSFFLNFLFGMIRVFIIPWFMNTDGFGVTKYGFFNGACSVGMVAGMLVLSVVTIKDKRKMFQIVFNTLMSTTILVNTEEAIRGKVSATRITLCMAASPIGKFVGGIIGDCMKA